MTTATTYELFERCVDQGDDESWEQFLSRCGSNLRRILAATRASLIGPLEGLEIEDLAQDLCCRLLAVPSGFEGRSDGEVWGYVWRAVRTLMSDRRRYLMADKRNADSRWHDPVMLEELICQHPDPERRLLAEESWERFLESCAGCFPRTRRGFVRRLIRLVLLEGCNSQEAAERLGMGLSAKQVDNFMVRLRRNLLKRGIHLPRRIGGHRRRPVAATVGSTIEAKAVEEPPEVVTGVFSAVLDSPS